MSYDNYQNYRNFGEYDNVSEDDFEGGEEDGS